MVDTPTIHPAIKAASRGCSRAPASDGTRGWGVRGLRHTTDLDEAAPIRSQAGEDTHRADTAAAPPQPRGVAGATNRNPPGQPPEKHEMFREHPQALRDERPAIRYRVSVAAAPRRVAVRSGPLVGGRRGCLTGRGWDPAAGRAGGTDRRERRCSRRDGRVCPHAEPRVPRRLPHIRPACEGVRHDSPPVGLRPWKLGGEERSVRAIPLAVRGNKPKNAEARVGERSPRRPRLELPGRLV
jgi:hypothetical protein